MFEALAAGVLGLVFGSFANVVIWRMPREESLSTPGSHCPRCDRPVRWFDNVPVVSWVLLRARCRDCGAPISPRYPAVELLVGVLWAAAVWSFGATLAGVACAFMLYLLVILTFIDLDVQRLPNPLVALLGAVGYALAIAGMVLPPGAVPLTPVAGALSAPLAAALFGTVTAGGISLGIAALYSGARGRAGLGAGDVKLLAALGPFLGVYTIGVFFVGSLIGAVWGTIAAARSGRGGVTRFAFGPSLAIAAGLIAFVGPDAWLAYARLVGLA